MEFTRLLRESADLLFEDDGLLSEMDLDSFSDNIDCVDLEIHQSTTEYSVINPNAGMRLEVISITKKDESIAKYRKKRERRHKSKYSNVLASSRAPNMSRRVQGPALCAFPSFDKCDSLVFLPTTVVKCFNTEDFDALGKAFQFHMHKNCKVCFRGMQFNVQEFLQTMVVLSTLHPDKVSCCNDTKVIDNSIHAKVLCKFTDNSTVVQSVAHSGRSQFPALFPNVDRATRWKQQLASSQLSVEERERAVEAAATGADLLVYGCLNYVFTFDPHSRKVVRLEYDMVHTSVRAVQACCDASRLSDSSA